MRNQIKKEIKRLCKRAFDKAVSENETTEKYQEKFERRTRLSPGISTVHVRNYVNRQFDPRHCKRHANGISKSIWQKILDGNYEPKPALVRYIPKKDGSKREIMCFSIPDAAVANVLLRTARDRNKKKLSPHSYAYHPDKNLFDAVLAVNDYKIDGKIFAVQVDFEKYFDNISSAYIKKKLSDKFILSLTPPKSEKSLSLFCITNMQMMQVI